MDRINGNATVGKEYPLSEQEQKTTAVLQKGDIVEGTITGVSDMISITFSDKEVKVPLSAVQNAKEGQIRQFEIKDVSNKSIVLREVGINTEGKTSGVLQTHVYSGGKAFSGYIRENSGEDITLKRDQVLDQLQRAKTSLTAQDYMALKQENKEPEESSSEQFEKNLKRIKEQRQFTRKHLKRQIERLDVKRENIQRAALSASGGHAGEIAKRLEQADLPVTKANIARVSTALEMAGKAPQLKDGAKAYLLENQLDVTPKNIYKAAYSGNNTQGLKEQSLSEEDWKALEPSVEKQMANEGMEVTAKNLTNAKWLLSMNLPVTGGNLAKLSYLNTLSGEYSQDKIMSFCIQGMQEGSSPEETDLVLMDKSLEDIKKTIATMDQVEKLTGEDAEQVPKEEKISLTTIASYGQQDKTGKEPGQILKNLTARRQLEEVRQRLTMESCYRLYQQGIEVDTESLESVINELKAMETQYYQQYYAAADIDPSKQQLDWLQNTEEVVRDLTNMPEMVYGATFLARSQMTLRGLKEEAVAYEERREVSTGAERQIAAYETVGTAPRKDLGDSIQKAFGNVDAILEEIGLEPTEANRQAVRILGYNAMDITPDAVTEMKSYEMQVEDILTALTPEVAVKIIREGENPLEIPLTTLSRQLEVMKQTMDTTSEAKFSEYLYRLDQKKELSEEERGAYIGIYRLLYQVEKSDGAVVGAVVKANQDLTLSNLLTAVRSRKKEGMDITITKEDGGVEAISKGDSISGQISKAFLGRKMTQYVYEKLQPELLDSSYEADTMDSMYDIGIEQLYENATAVGAKSQISSYETQRYEQMVLNYGRTKEAAMLVANGQTVSANQLEAASLLMAEGSTFYRDLKSQAEEMDSTLGENLLKHYETFIDSLGQGDQVEQAFGSLTEDMTKMLEQSMNEDTVTAQQVEQIRRYHNCIRLAEHLSRNQTFELPIVLGEDVVNLKVQLVEGQQQAANLKVQMSDNRIGTVDALAVVQDGSVSGYLVSDNREITDKLQAQESTMKQEIEGLGLATSQLTISLNHKTKDFYRTDVTEKAAKEKPSNQTLYQLAKIFVKYTKQAMAE